MLVKSRANQLVFWQRNDLDSRPTFTAVYVVLYDPLKSLYIQSLNTKNTLSLAVLTEPDKEFVYK